MKKPFSVGSLCTISLRTLILLLVWLCLPLTAFAAAVPDATTFIPKPGLRIFATGILGSDGTRFEKTLVTAKMDDESFVTEAEAELTYIEYNKPPQQLPEARAVWRYAAVESGIVKDPILNQRGYKKYFWLPNNVSIGTQWKASWGNKREIMENDVTVETPAGRFEGCIMVEYDVYAGGTGIERHYIAPGVGLVKIVSLKGPKAAKGTTWFEVQRIETVPEEEARRIVGQMLGL